MSIRELVRRRPWVIAVALLAAIAAWMASGLNKEADPASVSAGAREVSADAAGPQRVQARLQAAEPVTRTLTVYGRTAPARVVELKTETSGRVVAIGAARGARVAAGGLLLTLDDRDRAARLSEARAVVRQRDLEYQGQLKLKPQGYISEAKLAESAALLEGARAELRRAELDLEHRDIRAPFAGSLQDRSVEIGDYVSDGDVVATFVDDVTLIVEGAVAEHHAAALRTGAHGSARLATGQRVAGTVRYVAPVADPATRTFAIELAIDNPDGSLPAGVTSEIDLPAGTILAQRVSPALLTLNDEGELGVKTIDESGRVEFHRADIARSTSDGVWLAGLPNPARIITVGQGFVAAGRLVEVVDDSANRALASEESAAGEALK
jgi:membrane fusion protein, multidrug efflux system